MAAMMNMTNLLNGKDSRWLQLEVCREFQRNKCSRPDTECKFAHPPANVEVQNGRVTACYDSIKGRCNREKPPCKYFHPPQHLKDQLLINGRNHLALKNAIMQQMGISPGQPVLPGQVPAVATNPYLTGMPASTYSPYFPPGHLMPTLLGPADPSGVSQLGPVVQQAVVPAQQQKIPRSDRLEVCREFMRGACKRAESECRFAHPQESVTTHEDGSVTVCMDAVKGRCAREPCRYFHPPLHLQAQIKAAQSRATATAPVSAAAAVAAAAAAAAATMGTLPPPPPPSGAVTSTSLAIGQTPLEAGKKRAADNDMIQMMDMKTMGSFYYENFAFPGMVPYKRTAADKSGIPVYQPGATTYQQLMQLQQPFVPVSSSPTIPLNAPYVIYTDANGQSVSLVPPLQLLDTLPVCQDFNRSMCTRPTCRFVHLMECDKVEVCDQRVAVCRDHAKGMCKRKQCKYYHIPIVLPPANVMAATTKLAE
ncbi:protein muscleblind isoform X17 [Wyeomyia smithii]|uniref:protein muscleblind isoform X17 n=1 Tax=Wyeomyia smithii TaxID=174621 RepID=UPI002467E22A|nr:protein muscleblind isoform X17 [Wyeomyia smithii]